MSIVSVNVSQQVGAIPSQLQRTGALVSIGGTSLAANSSLLLTQLSDLTSSLAGAVSITAGSTTWATGTVTMTTATAHGYLTGDYVTVAGFVGAGYVGYNGTYMITVTSPTTFTYAQATTLTSPASGTAVVTDQDVAELTAMATTFFAQGSSLACYVLELGHGTIAADVTALGTYITNNPLKYYRYLVPREFAAEATFVTLMGNYNSNTAKVYFHVTSTLGNYSSFTATMKSVLQLIEAPTIPATEFTSAGPFWNALNYNPSSTNQVTPFCYSFVYGVTQYPVTNSQITTFKTANLNYITSAAEGGITNSMLVNGTMCDGKPLNYWYSADWVQVNIDLQISNAVINGSNNPLAPLYYNQPGINRLDIVQQSVAAQAVSYGLALGPVIAYQKTSADWATFLGGSNLPLGFLTNAVPFASYVAINPLNYPLGLYGGLSSAYTPAQGFQNIVFNLLVSNIPV